MEAEDVLEKLRADVDSLAAELETEQALSKSLSEENRKLESLLKDGAKEKAVMQPAVQATKPDVMWVLSQLEDQFQCSLCVFSTFLPPMIGNTNGVFAITYAIATERDVNTCNTGSNGTNLR